MRTRRVLMVAIVMAVCLAAVTGAVADGAKCILDLTVGPVSACL